MDPIVFQKFYSEVADKKFRNFYFLYGDEEYLIERSYKYLSDSLLPLECRDFNFHVYYPEEVKAENILDTYEMYPMMSARRVMVFKSVGLFGDAQNSVLQEIFAKPNELVTAIFLGPFLDKKKKVFKILNAQSEAIEFKKPYDNQVPYWIKHLGTELGLEIDQEAIHQIHEFMGGDLRNIANELAKIKDYVFPKNQVSLKNILELLTMSSQDNSFLMVEKWINGDEAKRLKITEMVIDSGESELGFLQLLARHLRILNQIKIGQRSQLSKDQLSKKNGIPIFFVDKYILQSRHWSDSSISKVLSSLAKVELALKKNPSLKKAILNFFSFF